MQDGCKYTWIPTWHQMDHVHGHLNHFQKPPLEGRPNTNPLGDHGTPHTRDRWVILFYDV